MKEGVSSSNRMPNGINVYTCTKCGYKHITKHYDEGTTPFMMVCKQKDCHGMAQSGFYRVDQSLTPEFEWYKANLLDLDPRDLATIQHVRLGGLLLRSVKLVIDTTTKPN